jgi:hypothetical protein
MRLYHYQIALILVFAQRRFGFAQRPGKFRTPNPPNPQILKS